MKLKEEKLNISKEKVKTGKVSIHKEILTEQKNITIPIKKEELVIEKTVLDSNKQKSNKNETIRIPISEEKIEIKKEPIVLQSVSVKKHKYRETEHITEILKREMPHISTKGDVEIINKNVDEE